MRERKMINFKKWLSASVAGVMIAVTGAGAAACKKDEDIPLDSSHGIADQSNLYGMCYLLEERSTETLDIGNEVLLMKNLALERCGSGCISRISCQIRKR